MLWYILFGALHELAHVCTALLLGYSLRTDAAFWVGVLLQRRTDLAVDDCELVRHAGWIASCVIAIVLYKTKKLEKCKTAAFVTALEALSTDLLGLGHLLPAIGSSTTTAVLCGNFGVILLLFFSL